jgi:hypothetical protein
MDENTRINQVNYYIDRCVLQYFYREIIVFIFTLALFRAISLSGYLIKLILYHTRIETIFYLYNKYYK